MMIMTFCGPLESFPKMSVIGRKFSSSFTFYISCFTIFHFLPLPLQPSLACLVVAYFFLLLEILLFYCTFLMITSILDRSIKRGSS
jgi:hypothetical protein